MSPAEHEQALPTHDRRAKMKIPTMQTTTMQTARLVLEPLSSACEAVYEAFYTDAEASAAYGGPLTAAGAWNRLAADMGAWSLQGFGVWAIRRRAENDLVGVCGFWQGKGWPRELTWWLLPGTRGQGIAAEASEAVIRHAYVNLGWARVETYMNDSNAAARALVLRLGGVKTGRRRFPDGLERDLFLLPAPNVD
jgi:[ribosomal protein S5]-alanine N-acetyltransferase